MRTNTISMLFFTTLLFVTACVSEETTNKQTKQEQESDAEELTAFVVEEKNPQTRTTGEYDGSGIKFYWTQYDNLWVNNGTLKKNARNTISESLRNHPTIPTAVLRTPTAKFYFLGTYTAASYPVRYTGTYNNAGDKVNIAAQQEQYIANDASHLGRSGDCGTALATKSGSRYTFTLDHKAAYLTFLPYTMQEYFSNAVITQIKVTTEKAICGQFNFDDNGIDVDNSRPTASPVNQSIILQLNGGGNNGFPIPKDAANPSKNAAVMVLAPGTYNSFTVQYTIYDKTTSTLGTITKTYNNLTLAAGKNKRVHTNLHVKEYPAYDYYMWDAAEGQHYWKGYEWNNPNKTLRQQPTINGITVTAYAPLPSPESGSNPRGYRADTSSPVPPASRSAKDCPNVNEMAWYCMQGDPHWDSELWACMGHLYGNGMWFKRKSKIPGFSASGYTDPNSHITTDYRTSGYPGFSNSTTQGRPTNLNDYFFLPALGSYFYLGQLFIAGIGGDFWSSTPYGTSSAYRLNFRQYNVNIMSFQRDCGFVQWTSEDQYGAPF